MLKWIFVLLLAVPAWASTIVFSPPSGAPQGIQNRARITADCEGGWIVAGNADWAIFSGSWPHTRGFLWHEGQGGLLNLPTYLGLETSIVADVADDGYCVGQLSHYEPPVPLEWIDGTVGAIAATGVAYAVTPSGHVAVGAIGTDFDVFAPVWWDANGVIHLLPHGVGGSWATGVSADGLTIIGVDNGSTYHNHRAVMWTAPDWEMTYLDDLGSHVNGVSPNGVYLTGNRDTDDVYTREYLYWVLPDVVPRPAPDDFHLRGPVADTGRMLGSVRYEADGHIWYEPGYWDAEGGGAPVELIDRLESMDENVHLVSTLDLDATGTYIVGWAHVLLGETIDYSVLYVAHLAPPTPQTASLTVERLQETPR